VQNRELEGGVKTVCTRPKAQAGGRQADPRQSGQARADDAGPATEGRRAGLPGPRRGGRARPRLVGHVPRQRGARPSSADRRAALGPALHRARVG
jgi:hypothetical protein